MASTFQLPDDASQHARDLWELRRTLQDRLDVPAEPSSVVVMLAKSLADVDDRLAAMFPGFTEGAPADPAGEALDEFTKAAQAKGRRRAV